jgi:predicted nucleic acid-binding protein
MSQPNNPAGAVVIDANILIAICSNEPGAATARAALTNYTQQNWAFYAPSTILAEVLFVLCKKVQNGVIDAATYQKAIEDFADFVSVISPPPNGDAALLVRAEEMRRGYSCLHSADGFYLALTEALTQTGAAEFLTFDQRVVNVAARNAPTVQVNLLT